MPEIDDLLDALAEDAALIARSAFDGELTLREFERDMRDLLKRAHNGAALLGRDRPVGAVQRALDWIQRQGVIAAQYGYLAGFVADIRDGRYPSEAQRGVVEVRARMYVHAARQTFEITRESEAKRSGATMKRRVLHADESCEDCIEQAALGWVLIDDDRVTGVADGTTRCMTNCRCTIHYM